MRISKKILAIALSILMAVSMMPFTVFAATVEVNDVASFEDAVATAAAGDTIKLTGNVDLSGTHNFYNISDLPIKDEDYLNLTGVTLDLNGNTITTPAHWGAVFTGTNVTVKNGTFVGTDCSAFPGYRYGIDIWGAGGGTANGQEKASYILENLTIDGGIHAWNADVLVKNCDVTGSSKYYAIWADEDSVVTVESGEFTTATASTTNSAVIGAAKSSGHDGNIVVNGGNFTVPDKKKLVLPTSTSSKPENVKIHGGTFKNADDTVYTVPAINIAEGAEFDSTTGTVTQTYVAKIGDVKYNTLKDAWNAAKDGDTITLLADCNGDGLIAAQGKFNTQGLTVNFNGHTYSVTGETVGSAGTETIGFQLLKNNKITFKNGTITGSSRTNTTLLRIIQNYADLTLDNMTVEMVGRSYNQITMSNCNGDVVIKDSTVSAPDYSWANYSTAEAGELLGARAMSVGTFSTYTGVDVTVTDSTINGYVNIDNTGANGTAALTLNTSEVNGNIVDKSMSGATVTNEGSTISGIPEGYEWVNNGDGTSTLVEDNHSVAKIGNQKYDTLAEAIAAAQSGDTITILADTTVDNTIVLNDGRNITIDTNGKTISSTKRVFEIRHGGVTLTGNGTVSTTAVSAVAVYGSTDSTDADYATFTLGADATISAPSGYGAMIGANNKAAYGAKLTLNGTINSAYGVYVNGNVQEPADKTNAAQVTINGTVTAGNEEAAVYAAGYAKWAVNAGSTVSGGSGIYIKSGDLAVNGGTITANGTKTAYTFNTNGANGTGDAIIIDSCGYPGNVPTVAINAGTVTSANGDAVASYTKQDDPLYPTAEFPRVDEVIPATSTAVFSSNVSALAEEGYVTVYDANEGGYVVAKDTSDSISITTADEIDVNLYFGETGEEATVEYTFNTTPDIQENTQGTKVVDFDSLPEVAGKRKLTIRVAPAQIRDNITIYVKNAGGSVIRSYENYSVAEYCDQLVAGDYSANIKTLAKSVLDYGKAAANFFGYNEYAFTNQADNFNDFTFDTTGWTAVATDIDIEEVRYVATSVPSLRFKVDMSETEAERYTVETDKGYNAKFVKVGEDVILQVTGIPASKLGETIKVSVKNAQEDEIATIQYTPIIYAYNASKADNEELARLGKTIGQYSAAAKAVFA